MKLVGKFWSRAKQQVERVSNFIRKQNNFTDSDTDKAFGFFFVDT